MAIPPLDRNDPLLAERRRVLSAGEEPPINRMVHFLRCPHCGYTGPEDAFVALPDQAFASADQIAAFLEATLGENPRRRCPDCGDLAELSGIRLHVCSPSLERELVVEREGEATVVYLVDADGASNTVNLDDPRVEEACLDSCLRAGSLLGEMDEEQQRRALALVRRVARARPEDPAPRLIAARLHLRLDRPKEAAEQILRVAAPLRAQPRLALRAGALLGEAALDLGDDRLVEEALDFCRPVLEVESEAPAAHLALGRLLLESSRTAEARPHLEAAAREESQAFAAAFHLSVLASHEGRHEEAISILGELLGVQPYHVDLRRTLAWNLIQVDQLARAEEELAQVEKLDPGDEETAELRSALEERRGRA
jgi:hypothetical protein